MGLPQYSFSIANHHILIYFSTVDIDLSNQIEEFDRSVKAGSWFFEKNDTAKSS